MQLLSMDYMSLPAASGYKTVLVIIDYFTQYVWAYKFTTAGTGKTTIKALTDLFQVFGQPEVLMSDNGLHFANKEVDAFCADCAIVVAKTPPYLPHTNGAVEGANGLLINALKKELAAANLDKNSRNNQWPHALDLLVSRLNSRVVGTTRHRPADLLFAYVRRDEDPRRKPLGSNKLADELGKALTAVFDRRLEAAAHVAFSQARHELAFETMHERQAKRKAARDALQARVLQRQPANERSGHFKRGDLVMMHASWNDTVLGRKLDQQWHGPFTIVARGSDKRPDLTGNAHESNVTYWLFDQNSGQPISQRIHAHRLNPYRGERPRSMTHELPTLNKFFRHLRNAPELAATPRPESADNDKGNANADKESNLDNNSNDDNPLMMLHELFNLPAVIPDPKPGAAGTLAVPHAVAFAHKATPEGRFVKDLTTRLPPPGKPSEWVLAIGQVFATTESLPVHFLTGKVSAWSACKKPPGDERPAVEVKDRIRTDLAKLCNDAGSSFSDDAAKEPLQKLCGVRSHGPQPAQQRQKRWHGRTTPNSRGNHTGQHGVLAAQ
ncbi:hypothetical protein ACM66B_004603 [Microbotryomycetes sp. NB124-2]